MTFFKCLHIQYCQHSWPGMLQDVAIEYMQFHQLPGRLGEPTALGIMGPFHWHHLFSPPRQMSSCISHPHAPPSTEYLRQGGVEEGFTFFSHLKRKERPPGKQSLLSHTQAQQCLGRFYHTAIDAHSYHGKYVRKKNTEKHDLMIPNRV